MTTTTHYKGHRWTTDELRELMRLWAADEDVDLIANALNATRASILKMVVKLRRNGIPLRRRSRGNVAGRTHQLWTHGEVEYLIRRREEKATSEEIGTELGRTWVAVSAMIGKLRSEHVPIAMRGNGVRRLWNADALKSVAIQSEEVKIIELDDKLT